MEFIYPAIFTKEAEGFSVSFPDFTGAFTEGDNLKEAIDRAEDCLGGLLLAYDEESMKLPSASAITKFAANTENCFVNIIKVDVAEYRRRISDKPIKKTVYIPRGLNDRAEAQGINFSKTLRDALMNELN